MSGKRKIKFNILDVIIVLALLALVAGILGRDELSKTLKRFDEENTVAVLCEFSNPVEADERGILNNIKDNPDVYYNGVKVGTFAKVTVDESTQLDAVDSAEGGATVQERNMLALSVVAKDSGYYLGEQKLLIGHSYRFSADGWEFTAIIKSIELK